MKATNIWREMMPCLLVAGGIVIFLLLFLAAINQDKLVLTEGSIKVITNAGAGDNACEGLKQSIIWLQEFKQAVLGKIMACWQELFGV